MSPKARSRGHEQRRGRPFRPLTGSHPNVWILTERPSATIDPDLSLRFYLYLFPQSTLELMFMVSTFAFRVDDYSFTLGWLRRLFCLIFVPIVTVTWLCTPTTHVSEPRISICSSYYHLVHFPCRRLFPTFQSRHIHVYTRMFA
ncbi:hypothetical protein EDD85DRAFT_131566 [Armillaria nabsnona]|nr:hypothetical protein EDD85DRAFT_131566 [Armillaria nabsnona]